MVLYAQTPNIERTLSFMDNLFSSQSRLRRIASIPRDLIVLEVAVQWNMAPAVVAQIKESLSGRRETLAVPLWIPTLPRVDIASENGPWLTTNVSFCFQYPTKRTINEFITDLQVYVFRPFAKSPAMESLKIFILRNEATGKHKTLIITDSEETAPTDLKADSNAERDYFYGGDAVRIFMIVINHLQKEYASFSRKASEDLLQTVSFLRYHD